MKRLIFPLLLCLVSVAVGQSNPLDGIQQAALKNKQAQAHYTWQEKQVLSVGGEVKSTTVSQVQLGPDGQPQKTVISTQNAPQKETRGPLRKRVRERKVEEFKDYLKDVAALVHQYTQLDSAKLKAAFAAGNLKKDASPGAGLVQITVTSYLKPGDSLIVVFNEAQHQLQSVKVNSYLDNPGDVVSFDALFDKLPDGSGSHLSQSNVVGQDKDVTIGVVNSDYQKLP